MVEAAFVAGASVAGAALNQWLNASIMFNDCSLRVAISRVFY